ncbi:bifunctional UDP-N-acetylglucosamine diphosphorylase/glucosamine-1-phosphate N-acetyltransferase GlmU [Oharaeibacter diazotrophicus]|uniref:Bifunctional protein GlmU n=1 Tax=Oharaeibacter diazotrophicus TaxID=1920512 RepID=A0A4R6RG63_9HYPH|nr:bifunctional UDP-N-acetylglucosamine diphosphorylase/glucosamine-1-phosphate N-acetyltransferase GlmU [Oharaeibacter diazotrophicus]TDP85323.1 bifunctional UDP-N-acetylglucosamine pyrophosphorylase/glucosamine-1-phosphate N-acetyltransferase [Oharaeibacter diazotrophicus]BBE74294.1 bifunctional protein GlmU [Pleomorphomonas sp. SM30]GLS76016.1 bifunctional protein GlmU [Oharaeibacter diazotrophicus]
MTARRCLAVVLAAGEGTRMRSALPKVMHPVGGRPMLDAVIASARAAGADRVAVVVGAGADLVRRHLARTAPDASIHEQTERLGTAHAVLAARAAFAEPADEVVVLYGDTPLVRPETIAAVRGRLAAGVDVAVLGFEAADPTGYGRLVLDGERLVRIVEERDADAETRRIRLSNSGIMGFRGDLLPGLLDAVGNANAKGEYYLTDAIEIAVGRGLATGVVVGPEDEFLGVNDRVQLAVAEAVFQGRARIAAMRAGATLQAPETVFFSHDTRLGRDVVVEPNVVFGPGVTVADGVVVRAFSHLEGATVAAGATLGPYARLRPEASIGEGAHIGNFVEIKKADIAAGAKINHLSYIGDAVVGAGTNVGAGTITCNYDGVFKHLTRIGAGVFVGSNTTLVAPVAIGDGGYTAAGSVVTADVPADAVAFGRARQENKPGRAREIREALAAKKARKG